METIPFSKLIEHFADEDRARVARMTAALKKHHDSGASDLPDLGQLLAKEEAQPQTVAPEK